MSKPEPVAEALRAALAALEAADWLSGPESTDSQWNEAHSLAVTLVHGLRHGQ